MAIFVLPSPLLGPRAYHPLVTSLRQAGYRTDVAACLEPFPVDRLITDWARQSAEADAAVFIAHSNAGYLVPTVSERVGRRPMVFMDAALPPPSGSTRLAPPQFRRHLSTLADATGRLPPWSRWWPAEEMDNLMPGQWFERGDEDAPRLDLAYFDTEISVPARWTDNPAAYLAFGTTYAEEIEFATTSGWPVTQLDGNHMHHLTHPAETADAIAHLLQDAFDTPPPGLVP